MQNIVLAIFLLFSTSFTYATTRTLHLGLSPSYYVPNSDYPYKKKMPLGFATNFEFGVSSNSALGIVLNYRTTSLLTQMTYGLQMSHDFSENFYYSYGLLMQAIFRDDKTSHATAHDTRFALGFKQKNNSPIWCEVGYNLSKIYYFSTKTQFADHIDFVIGTFLTWETI